MFLLAISLFIVAALVLISCNGPAANTPGASTGESSTSSIWSRITYQLSWHSGDIDVNGKTMYASEIMRVLPYKGKLYASTDLWTENDPTIPKACQLLVLDSTDGTWQLLHQFTTRNLRETCLQNVTFTNDGQRKKIEPVEMLLAAPDTITAGDVPVFSLDDNTGKLVQMSIGSYANDPLLSPPGYASTRAISTHHDVVTGIDMIFAGNDRVGMVSGVYDPSVTGRIKWQSTPELDIPKGERVMAFNNLGGILYCATTNHIYKRIDGTNHSWQSVFYEPREINAVGLRGLAVVPNPSGEGEVLLFGTQGKICHIDPDDNYKVTVELNINSYLTQLWNRTIVYTLYAYTDFLPYTVQGTGEQVYLFGFEALYSRAEAANHPEWRVFNTLDGPYAAEGRYFIRHVNGGNVSYELAEITDPTLPTLVSVRTICISPFPADQGRVLYFGGFDPNFQPTHLTGWISRGVLPEK